MGIAKCLKKIKADVTNNILLDGSLRAPQEFHFQKTIIKGDEKEYSIGLASIAAKVIRDRKMEDFALKYPQYGFDIHKGYGTVEHRKSIKKHGPSEVHRKSFLKNI
jgi:ribonuclease HII